MTTIDAVGLQTVMARIDSAARAAGRADRISLLAVSKKQPASAIRTLAGFDQKAFGENYVQEAIAKQAELVDLALEWHMIGPLQSNKCREVAEHFDWLHSLDRIKLIAPLARYRESTQAPLSVLIQVNIDDEASKSGCDPEAVGALADAIAEKPSAMRLRGLMAIPAPDPDFVRRQRAFARMHEVFNVLRRNHPTIDTLSMGMSDDFELAIAEGATLVRIGTLLFGPRR